MNKLINYEDDIFYIKLLFKNLEDSSKLKIDVEIFKKKIIQDIQFLDQVTEYILNNLKQTSLTIKLETYFRNLKKILESFIRYLKDIIRRKSPRYKYFKDQSDKIKLVFEKSKNNLNEIKALLASTNPEQKDAENIISQEEFRILLKEEEEDI